MILIFATVAIGGFVLMQLVPYRVSNAATRSEPAWDSPRTRELAVRACYDCHSNEVKTPWYGKVAPVSWWLTHHVEEGRAKLNFSDWTGPNERIAERASRTVLDGRMPPSSYHWFGLHSSAKLTPAEQQELAQGLLNTLNR